MTVWKLIRKRLNSTLSPLGFRIQRIAPLDLRKEISHPLEALALPHILNQVVIDVPIERLRGLYWFRFAAESHPFVVALVAYRDRGIAAYDQSPLRAYYESCQPQTAAEVLGLSSQGLTVFHTMPPTYAVLPWLKDTPEQHAEHRRDIERAEAEEHGFTLEGFDGTKLYGPVTPRKGSLELSRLIKVYESMRQSGYSRWDNADGDIGGTMLLHQSGEWCVQLWQGHHRAAAAAALGLKSIPVRFAEAPVRSGDVRYWPLVSAGHMSEEHALSVFDRILHGDSQQLS